MNITANNFIFYGYFSAYLPIFRTHQAKEGVLNEWVRAKNSV